MIRPPSLHARLGPVANTKLMFSVAKEAGVNGVVHVSITNPDINSDLPHFRGKAALEPAPAQLGVSYCILRPTVLFGKEDVLIKQNGMRLAANASLASSLSIGPRV